MKRDLHNPHPPPHSPLLFPPYKDTFCSGCGYSTEEAGRKSKMREEHDAGMDELLAVLGYKVKVSDMSEVAQKLEQLEEVMGHAQEDGLSHLASETVHYNPSNLSSWLESMIFELYLLPNFDSSLRSPLAFDNHCHPLNHRIFQDSSSDDYDLKAIAGKAVYPEIQHPNKHLKPSYASSSSTVSSILRKIQRLPQLSHELSSLINEVDVDDEAADGDTLNGDLHPAIRGGVKAEDGAGGVEEAELGLKLDELSCCARSVAVFFC
ncbi:unnamed protein product [Camellia sinensis]